MNKELLYKYIIGDATPEERDEVMHWIDADEANMKEFLAARKLYTLSVWHQEQFKAPFKGQQYRENKSVRIFKETLKIAAAVIIAFSLAYIYLNQHQLSLAKTIQQTVYVPAGQRAEVMLADGSHVWLNAKTKFTFPTNFKYHNRIVKLDGEAYFDVKHDAKKPFIVKAGDYNVQVYGTEFNINAYSEKSIFETALLKGSVRIEMNNRKGSILLKPGYKLNAKGDIFTESPISQYNYYKWTEGLICFDDITIGDLLNKLELYFDVRFVINNTQIITQRYTGKFRTNDGVEQILKTLQLRSKFKYHFNDDRDIITIN